MNQIDFYKEVVRLESENPGIGIMIYSFSNPILEDFTWTAQRIWRVDIDYVFRNKRTVSIGIEDIKDAIETIEDKCLSEDEIKQRSKKMIIVTTELS